MGRLRQQVPESQQPFTQQLQTEGPSRQAIPAVQQPQIQQPQITPQQQDAQRAQALSQNLDRVGQSISGQARQLDAALPLTQKAGEEQVRQVEEGAKALAPERPAEAAEVTKSGELAKDELEAAKKAKSAGDGKEAESHLEKAKGHLSAALEKADAIARLDLAVRDLADAGAPSEIVKTMKSSSVKPAVARELSAYAKSATEELKKTASEDKGALGSIYARGLMALKSGKKVEADLHSSLAKAYPRAGPADKKKIDDASSASAKGRMSAAEVMALMSALRTGPSGAGIPPGKIRERLLALQKKIIELSGMSGKSAEVSKISALVSPATRYLARAEEARRVGDDAKAAELEGLALRHIDEAEAIVKESEAPPAIAEPPGKHAPSPEAVPEPEAKIAEPYSAKIKGSLASIMDADVLALLTTTLASLARPTDDDLKKADALAALAGSYSEAEKSGSPDAKEIKSVMQSVFEGKMRPENAAEYIEIFVAARPKAAKAPAAPEPRGKSKLSKLAAAAKPKGAKPPSVPAAPKRTPAEEKKPTPSIPPAPEEVLPEEEKAEAAEKPPEEAPAIPADLMEFAKAEFAGREGQLEALLKMGGGRSGDLLKALGGVYSEKIGKTLARLKDEDLGPAMTHLTSMTNPTLGDLRSAKEFYERASGPSEEPKPAAAKPEITGPPTKPETARPETKGPTVIDFGFAPSAAPPPAVSATKTEVEAPAKAPEPVPAPPTGIEVPLEPKEVFPEEAKPAEDPLVKLLELASESGGPEEKTRIEAWLNGLADGSIKREDVLGSLGMMSVPKMEAFLKKFGKMKVKDPELLSSLKAICDALRDSPSLEDINKAHAAEALLAFYVANKEKREEIALVVKGLAGGKMKPESALGYASVLVSRNEVAEMRRRSGDKAPYERALLEIDETLGALARGEDVPESALNKVDAYTFASRAYSGARDKADKDYALSIITRLSEGKMTPDSAIALSNILLKRFSAESAIGKSHEINDKKAALADIRYYFGVASLLYERGDYFGAKSAFSLAALYVRTLPHGTKGDGAAKFIRSILGDSETPLSAPIPFAETLAGKGLSPADLEFEISNRGIEADVLGAEATAAGIKDKEKAYSFKAGSAARRAAAAKKKGEKAKADSYERLSGALDPKVMASRRDEAVARYREGAESLGEALGLAKKAGALKAAAESEPEGKKKAELLGESERLFEEARIKSANATAAMDAAGAELAALSKFHDSVGSVRTIHWESGLTELLDAAESFGDFGKKAAAGMATGDELKKAEGAGALLVSGIAKVNAEKSLTKALAAERAELREDAAVHEKNKKAFEGVTVPLPLLVMAPDGTMAIAAGPSKIPAYAAEAIDASLEKRGLLIKRGKADLAGKERLRTKALIKINETRAGFSLTHYRLWSGADDVETGAALADKSTAEGMRYFRTDDFIGRLDDASAAAEKGDLGAAFVILKEVKDEAAVAEAKQTLHNFHTADERILKAVAVGKEKVSKLSDEPALKALGIPDKMNAALEREAAAAKDRSGKALKAIDDIKGPEDLLTPAIIPGLVAAGLFEKLPDEERRKIEGKGDDAILAYLLEHPETAASVAAGLRESGAIGAGLEGSLVVASEHKAGLEKYAETTRGLAFGIDLAEKGAAVYATGTELRKSAVGPREIGAAKNLAEKGAAILQIALFASDSPEKVRDSIIRGVPVGIPPVLLMMEDYRIALDSRSVRLDEKLNEALKDVLLVSESKALSYWPGVLDAFETAGPERFAKAADESAEVMLAATLDLGRDKTGKPVPVTFTPEEKEAVVTAYSGTSLMSDSFIKFMYSTRPLSAEDRADGIKMASDKGSEIYAEIAPLIHGAADRGPLYAPGAWERMEGERSAIDKKAKITDSITSMNNLVGGALGRVEEAERKWASGVAVTEFIIVNAASAASGGLAASFYYAGKAAMGKGELELTGEWDRMSDEERRNVWLALGLSGAGAVLSVLGAGAFPGGKLSATTSYGGLALMGAGLAMTTGDVMHMIESDARWYEYFVLIGTTLPDVMTGLALALPKARRPSAVPELPPSRLRRIGKGLGKVSEVLFLGSHPGEAEEWSGAELSRYKKYSTLPEAHKDAYHSAEVALGREFSPEEGIKVMEMLEGRRDRDFLTPEGKDEFARAAASVLRLEVLPARAPAPAKPLTPPPLPKDGAELARRFGFDHPLHGPENLGAFARELVKGNKEMRGIIENLPEGDPVRKAVEKLAETPAFRSAAKGSDKEFFTEDFRLTDEVRGAVGSHLKEIKGIVEGPGAKDPLSMEKERVELALDEKLIFGKGMSSESRKILKDLELLEKGGRSEDEAIAIVAAGRVAAAAKPETKPPAGPRPAKTGALSAEAAKPPAEAPPVPSPPSRPEAAAPERSPGETPPEIPPAPPPPKAAPPGGKPLPPALPPVKKPKMLKEMPGPKGLLRPVPPSKKPKLLKEAPGPKGLLHPMGPEAAVPTPSDTSPPPGPAASEPGRPAAAPASPPPLPPSSGAPSSGGPPPPRELAPEEAVAAVKAKREFAEHEGALPPKEAMPAEAPEVPAMAALGKLDELKRIYERKETGETLPPEEEAAFSEVKALMGKGMGKDAAMAHVADRRAMPDAVSLSSGAEGAFGGTTPDIYAAEVPIYRDGALAPARAEDAPRPRLLEAIDADAEGVETGSTARVYRAELLIDGKPKEIAAKIYKKGTKDHFDYMLHEHNTFSEMGKDPALAEFTPGVYGIVNVDGNLGYAMDIVPGKAVELKTMTADEVNAFVTEGTRDKLGRMLKALTDAGYEVGDLQFAIITENCVINGKAKAPGDVVMWDVGGARKVGYTPDSAKAAVDGKLAEVGASADRILIEGSGGFLESATLDERKALETVARGAVGKKFGTPPERVKDPLKRFLLLGAKERSEYATKFIESLPPAESAALNKTLKEIEGKSGVRMLEEKAAPAAVPSARAAEPAGPLSGLKLDDPAEGPKNLALFARKIVLRDPEAISAMDKFPPEARKATETLCADTGFETFAKHMSAEEFEKNWGRVRSRKNAIAKALEEVLKAGK